MSKLRSISTSFWSDPFIEELTPTHKLLFIYLITNDKTNMLGIYENSVKKMAFETGIEKKDVVNGLKAFERLGKVQHKNNYVILTNYMKHQNFNTNMKKSAIDIYNKLPKELKIKGLEVSKSNPLKSFESLLKGYVTLSKIEREYEVEIEIEEEYEEEREEEKRVVFPFDSEIFKKTWNQWKEYKKIEHKFNYKSAQSEQAALMKLNNISKKNEIHAIEIIKESIANGWKGFFENKTKENEFAKNTTEKINNAVDEFYS